MWHSPASILCRLHFGESLSFRTKSYPKDHVTHLFHFTDGGCENQNQIHDLPRITQDVIE